MKILVLLPDIKIKALVTKLGGLTLIPGAHIVEEEKFPKVVL